MFKFNTILSPAYLLLAGGYVKKHSKVLALSVVALAPLQLYGNNPSSSAEISTLDKQIHHFENSITELEDNADHFHPALGEQLGSLADLYQQRGHHRKALQTLEKAHLLNRINRGIYHEENSLLLEKKITSLMELKHWDKVGDLYSELFWLQRRQYGENDPRLRPLIERIGQWHIRAYAFDLGGNMLNHLVSAHKLFSLSLTISRQTPSDLSQSKTLEGLAVASYFLASYQEEPRPEIDVKTSFSQDTAKVPTREEQLIMSSYSNGLRALKHNVELIQNSTDAPAKAYPEALVKLGDWYQLFGKRASASKYYKQAWQLLAEQNDNKTQKALFGVPVNLPSSDLIPEPPQNTSTQDVILTFSVSRFGSVRKVNIIHENSVDNVSLKLKAKRLLKAARFRPRIENGKPITTKNMRMRYRFDGENA